MESALSLFSDLCFLCFRCCVATRLPVSEQEAQIQNREELQSAETVLPERLHSRLFALIYNESRNGILRCGYFFVLPLLFFSKKKT